MKPVTHITEFTPFFYPNYRYSPSTHLFCLHYRVPGPENSSVCNPSVKRS